MDVLAVDYSDPDNFPQPVDFWLMEFDFLNQIEQKTIAQRVRMSQLMKMIDEADAIAE